MDDLEKFQTVNEEWSKMQHWGSLQEGPSLALGKAYSGEVRGAEGRSIHQLPLARVTWR